MPNQTVALLLRVQVDGKRLYLNPSKTPNGNIRALMADYQGSPTRFADGSVVALKGTVEHIRGTRQLHRVPIYHGRKIRIHI